MAKTKTLDGERTTIAELNTGSDSAAVQATGSISRWKLWLKNLNLVMAGMYTGLNCYGTPKTHHEYEDREDKPDNRPL